MCVALSRVAQDGQYAGSTEASGGLQASKYEQSRIARPPNYRRFLEEWDCHRISTTMNVVNAVKALATGQGERWGEPGCRIFIFGPRKRDACLQMDIVISSIGSDFYQITPICHSPALEMAVRYLVPLGM